MMKEKRPLPASWEGGITGLVEALPACPTFNCFQGTCNTNISIAGHGHGNDWRFCSRFSKTGRLFNEQDQSRDPDAQSYLYLPSHQRKRTAAFINGLAELWVRRIIHSRKTPSPSKGGFNYNFFCFIMCCHCLMLVQQALTLLSSKLVINTYNGRHCLVAAYGPPFPLTSRWMSLLQTNLHPLRLPEEHSIWTWKQELQGHRRAADKGVQPHFWYSQKCL